MVDFITPTGIDYEGVASDGESIPIIVIVGAAGTIIWSAQVYPYSWETADRLTYLDLHGVDYGGGYFIAVGDDGTILSSTDGQLWTGRPSGTTEDLYCVKWISGSTWAAGGTNGKILKSTDDGQSWAAATIAGSSYDSDTFYGIAFEDNSKGIAVGEAGAIIDTTDAGANWNGKSRGTYNVFRDIFWADSKYTMVGYEGEVVTAATGATSITPQSAALDEDWYGVGYGNSLWNAVGNSGATMTSSDAVTWTEQEDKTGRSWRDVLWTDSRFIVVGIDNGIGYSTTGEQTAGFDEFLPLSDDYRAMAFVAVDGYVILIGTREFESGVWNYYPRRLRWTAPGTFSDFTGTGASFMDAPGAVPLLGGIVVDRHIILAEGDKIGLVSPGMSTSLPWIYRPLDKERWMLSNPVAVNHRAYFIDQAGLLCAATPAGVQRVATAFDLSKYDDWEPDADEPVQMTFHAHLGALVVFRYQSPYRLDIIAPEAGEYTTWELPELVVDNINYHPMGISAIKDATENYLYIGYGPAVGTNTTLVTTRMNFDAAIRGTDDVTSTEDERWVGDLQTGLFRVIGLGINTKIAEVEVRTYCDGTTAPDVAVQVRSTKETTWRASGADDNGSILVSNESWDAHDEWFLWDDGVEVGTQEGWTHIGGNTGTTDNTTPRIIFSSWGTGYSWYKWDTPESLADVDITAEFATGGSGRGRIRVRMDEGDTSYYQVRYDDGANDLTIHKEVAGGGQVSIGNDTPTIASPFYLRFYVSGSTLKAKVWNTGDSEPAWNIEETDSDVADAGVIYIGMTRASGTAYCNDIDVTNLATGCVGTGTAWSNTIAAGDDVETVFDLPCRADSARVYRRTAGPTDVLQVLGTDYTASGTKEITLTAALESGTDLYCEWKYPLVKMEANDYITTSAGWHRITSITRADLAVLEWYPAGGAALVGTHVKAQQMTAGEHDVLVFGIDEEVYDLAVRVVVIPRDSSDSSTIVKATAFEVIHQPTGQEHLSD